MRKLGGAPAAQKREAWVDWKDIPLTAEWQREIFTNIEAADNFIFVISPESAPSPNCKKEIDHAVANNKRMVPIFHRPVPDEAIPASPPPPYRLPAPGPGPPSPAHRGSGPASLLHLHQPDLLSELACAGKRSSARGSKLNLSFGQRLRR